MSELEVSRLTDDIKEQKTDNTNSKILIPIGICLWINRISAIHLLEQSFNIDAKLIVSWPATKDEYDGYRKCQENDTEWKPKENLFQNKIQFVNGKLNVLELKEYNVVKKNGVIDHYGANVDTYYEYIICVVYVLEGEFSEEFELGSFPFDSQDLQVKFCSFHGNYYITPSLYCGKDDEGNYGHLGGVDCFGIDEYNVGGIYADFLYPRELIYRIKLSRKWEIYFWKIFIFMFVTSLCSLLVFTMDNDKDIVADKYGLLLTLLLTAVAYQFVVATTYIPNLPYNTFLDWYITVSFLIIFGIIIITAIIQLTDIDDDVYQILAIISLIIFVAIHIFFVIKAIVLRKREKRKLTMGYHDLVGYGVEKSVQSFLLFTQYLFMDNQYKQHIDTKKYIYADIPETNYKH